MLYSSHMRSYVTGNRISMLCSVEFQFILVLFFFVIIKVCRSTSRFPWFITVMADQ